MNPEHLQVEIKARSPGETVALAARMVQHRPGPFVGAWAFHAAGIVALGHLALGVFGLSWGWAACLVLLIQPVFSLPMVTTAGHLVFSPRVSVRTIASTTLRRGPVFLLLFFANRLMTLVGLSLFLVPGLYLWRASWFLAPIVALEGASARASLRRGRRFAMGYHAHVVGHAFNAGLTVGYLSLAFGSVAHFLVVRVFGQSFVLLADLPRVQDLYYPYVALAGFALAAPFVTLAWFFVYLDVRIRKEGWDLEIAFRTRAAQLLEQHRAR